MMRLRPGPILAACALLLVGGAALLPRRTVELSIDPGQHFQTFRDWESTIEVLWTPDYEPYRQEIYDRITSDIGITRLRLETFSGAENTARSFERFRAGEIDMGGWRAQRYATVNDDDDPFHINWAGFDFADLDFRVETHLLPILEKAKAAGRPAPHINFTYVAFTNQIKDGIYIHTDPEEYGEFALAAFLHLRDKYGIVPDYFEPLLEPDNVKEWTPAKLGEAIAAATRRLMAVGFAPKITLPSVTNIHNAIPWLKEIEKVPGAMDLAAEFSFHRYFGGQIKVLQAIHDRAEERRLDTAMLEHWGGKGTYDELHNDLKYAQVSAWQNRSVMAGFVIGADGQLRLAEDVRYTRQYSHYIRPGAVRIGAETTAADDADPLAFVNSDGNLVVEIKTGKARPIEISGLPPGPYRMSWAISGTSGERAEPVVAGSDGRASFIAPGVGVVTLVSAAP